MTILVFGGTGQVGRELLTALAVFGPISAPHRREADLNQTDTLSAIVRRVEPRLIVNAAAYTAVDKAEEEPELAMAVNGIAPAILAQEAKRLGIPIIHYSTDYVFDGSKDSPYTESDAPSPLGVYGRTKLAGEQAIRATGAAHLILRTSWVYGTHGRNFLRTMLRLFGERETLSVVDDQIGAPTWSRMIAQATAAFAAQCLAPKAALRLEETGGIYHLTAGGATSWLGFARAIADADPARAEHRVRELQAIATEDYPTLAVRPRNSRLDCTALRETFGITLPDWRESLLRVMEEGAVSRR